VTRRVPTGTVWRKGRKEMAGMMREKGGGVERPASLVVRSSAYGPHVEMSRTDQSEGEARDQRGARRITSALRSRCKRTAVDEVGRYGANRKTSCDVM
jgi:hypothetical protein